MTFQYLISAVEKDEKELTAVMNLQGDAVLVDQCSEDARYETQYGFGKVLTIRQNGRGVGLSRNTALENADSDICLFSDEDIEYYDGCVRKVTDAFASHPDAAVIAFNIDVDERRRTYHNDKERRVSALNYGRYPAYALAISRQKILDKDIRFSLLFGGGAKYSNGEDSLFLHDCLKKHLKIYAVTECLGREKYRESTWFKGYTDKFFFDRGVLYHFLYGKAAALLGFRFLYKNRDTMLKERSLKDAFRLLKKGIAEGKTL
ncbi:MAG: glycosyltransferase [Lachnospiraceae bacterium]|nr:glycosyltransferase [Lachnospiraceae bacterium]